MGKIYKGVRDAKHKAQVYVDDVLLDVEPSRLLHDHAPDFEWSYGGQGPHQLALAILYDCTLTKDLSLENYRAFCDEFIDTAPYETFTILELQIRDWLAKRLRRNEE
jgi:hypothetical protein